jgi:hypothetical protein
VSFAGAQLAPKPAQENRVIGVIAKRRLQCFCGLVCCAGGVAIAQPVVPPPPPPEKAAEFADSLTDAALTNDPDAIYRRDGQRRTVDLGRGWSAWLDRTQASQLNNVTGKVINAGGRETRVGFDFNGSTGLNARISSTDLETARANEIKLAGAHAPVGGLSWVVGLEQLRASSIDINRGDASALAVYRFSADWLGQAGVHRASLKDDTTGADEKASFARASLSYNPQALRELTLSAQLWRAIGSDDEGRLSFNADYALAGGGRLYAGTSPRISLLSGGGLQSSQTFAHVVGAQTPLPRGWGEVFGEWRGKSLADADDQVLITGWRNRFELPARFTGELRLEHAEPLDGANPLRVNTIGTGVNRRNVPENVIGTWLEYTHTDVAHSAYALVKYTQRVTDNAVFTVRIQGEDQRPDEGVGGKTDVKLSSGLAWREPDDRRLATLYRYSYINKDVRDAGQFDRAAHVVSGQFQYTLAPHASIAARYAARRAREEAAAGLTTRTSHLLAARVIWPLHRRRG